MKNLESIRGRSKKTIELRLKKEGKLYRCNKIDIANMTINYPFLTEGTVRTENQKLISSELN